MYSSSFSFTSSSWIFSLCLRHASFLVILLFSSSATLTLFVCTKLTLNDKIGGSRGVVLCRCRPALVYAAVLHNRLQDFQVVRASFGPPEAAAGRGEVEVLKTRAHVAPPGHSHLQGCVMVHLTHDNGLCTFGRNDLLPRPDDDFCALW